MKGRLIVPSGISFSDGARQVAGLPAGDPIPDGFEEFELEIKSSYSGTVLVSEEKRDPCRCGDERRSHVGQKGKCLARKNAVHCDCIQFREKR